MKYFDYAATCPLDEEAATIYLKTATDYFGNSQSLHDFGEESHSLLESCRVQFGDMLGVEKSGVFFTSGGSESNFLAIEALISAKKKPGNHIITSIAEHSSIHSSIERLKKNGYRVTYLPFSSEGLMDVSLFTDSICEDTVLAIIQHGNSELGTIQPINKIGQLCSKHHILFHSDCVQTFGKLDLRQISPSIDSLSLSGHKFYGPKGIGVIYIRPQLCWSPSFPNTTHEGGFRPGTVNVPGIAAMTIAAKKTVTQLEQNQLKLTRQRSLLIETMKPFHECLHVHGSFAERQLPNILGMGFDEIEGQWIMLECNRKGFAISTGSACHSGLLTPANSMTALGYSGKKAKEYFRVSLGRDTNDEDIISLGTCLVEIVKQFKTS